MSFPAKLDVVVEAKKVEITAKWQVVKAQMEVFTVNDLKAHNRKVSYPAVSDRVETLLANLLIFYQELFGMIADKGGDEMKAEQEKCIQQEAEIKDFLSNLEDRYYELEAEEASKSKASVPDAHKTKLELLSKTIRKQLEDSRRREAEEKRAKREKERITKEIIKAKFHVKSNSSK